MSHEEDKPLEIESDESDQQNNNQENDLAGLENDDNGNGGEAQIVIEEDEQPGELEDVPQYMLQDDEEA